MNQKNKLSDAELVTLIQDKSEKGATALYDLYALALLLAIFRIVHRKNEAEHILELTLISACQHINQYDGSKEKLLCWMMQIARNFANEAVTIKPLVPN